jgi:hypothetical protein
MTNRDIFVQIIHEITGQPKEELGELVAACKKLFGQANWEKELADAEAQELLVKLRTEKPGIQLWLIRGGLMANPGDIRGSS